MSNAESLFFNNVPPMKTGMHVVQSNAVEDTPAESMDWVGGLSTDAPKGMVHLSLEALAQDVYVRFGPTSTTATTTLNGRLIKAGSPACSFYVSPTKHRYIDHIGGAAGATLKVQVSSNIGERETI